jgi:hypothetical protein
MYIQRVTAAHDYEDLHRLVDQLTPAQVRELRKQALRLAGRDDAASGDGESDRTPAFAGIFDGPQDLAEQVDDFVAERFNHSL